MTYNYFNRTKVSWEHEWKSKFHNDIFLFSGTSHGIVLVLRICATIAVIQPVSGERIKEIIIQS